MFKRGIHIVDQDQAQVPGIQARQCGVDGQELAPDLLDGLGAAGIFQALAQQRQHFAVGTATLALVLVQNRFVKGFAQNAGLVTDVFTRLRGQV